MTVRNLQELQDEINTLLADNNSADISAADNRSVLLDITESLAFLTQVRTDADINTLAAAAANARFTDTLLSKLNGIFAGANQLTPYKLGNIYRASPAGTVPAKPGNTEGTASVSGITAAPDNWLLARPEPTAALPDIYDCHVYGYVTNGVFGVQYGTPNRTDRYVAGGASSFADLSGTIADGQVPDSFTRDTELAAYAPRSGATFTGETGGLTPVNDSDFATKIYVDAAVAGTTPPSPQSEEIYYGLIGAAAEAASVDVTALTMEDATVAGHNITLGPAASGQFFVILTPAAHDILTLVNSGTQANELSAYTKTEGVRNLNSESYDAYTLGPLNPGATISYRLTLTE